MMRFYLFGLALSLNAFAFGQQQAIVAEVRIPHWSDYVQQYLKYDSLQIDAIRQTSDVLTNYWMDSYEGLPLEKRRKAVVRHVKHINETLEFYANTEVKADWEIKELLFELEYLKRSYLQKSEAALHPEVTRADKISMLKSTLSSRRKMVYLKHDGQLLLKDSSFFWTPVNCPPAKRFSALANSKKIDTDHPMVVLFDALGDDGSAPKLKTVDTDLDNAWTLKWGDEVHTDVVGSRLFAALGYDVDHPYFFGENELILVLDNAKGVGSWNALKDSIRRQYQVDLTPFFLREGVVNDSIAVLFPKLEHYIGATYVTFRECAIEARPDRVKRLGSFLPDDLMNENVFELRAALLAHVWIDNWDVREQNTLLTTVHDGNHQYYVSAVFSDLGTSLGVKLSPLSGDFKVGLVNELAWKAAKSNKKKVRLLSPINEWLKPYQRTNYVELNWMAHQIAKIDEATLREIIAKSGWPEAVQELYFHKLASRRASILEAFEVEDPSPIDYDRHLNFEADGVRIRNGKLLKTRETHPEHLTGRKGRMRNYGN